MSTSPSFVTFTAASDASSRCKSRNRSRDTWHEQLLRRTLWRIGLRYRKNVSDLPGKPDIVFPGFRIAVFCDGDFWHGRCWSRLETKLRQGTNGSYWRAKILSNIERDRKNTQILRSQGWRVLRFWETDILANPDRIAGQIRRTIVNARSGESARQ